MIQSAENNFARTVKECAHLETMNADSYDALHVFVTSSYKQK
jgi:hypothetical protein